MVDTKGVAAVNVDVTQDIALSSPSIYEATRSTHHDIRNMKRMGHRQELVRYFSLWKSTAFVSVAVLSWELTMFTLNQGLIGGGRAGLIWSMVWSFIAYTPVFLTMAEMASMAPISGSQYHWVSEFAPEAWQKSLSYFTGWMSTLAWQAGNAQGFLLTAQIILALISIGDTDYAIPAWQGTLLTIAIAAVNLGLNFYFTKYLPKVQSLMFFVHAALYIIIIVIVAVRAPKASHADVWTSFEGTGGWSPPALGVLAGQLTALSAFTGADTATHMAEEINDAGRNVPRAMVFSFLISSAMCFSAVVVILYGIPDIDAALSDSTGYPVIHVLRQCMNDAWLIVFCTGLVVILFCGNVNYLLAVSRDLWAFARDRGTPFANTLSKVSNTRHIPTNAIVASCIIASFMSVLYIGSSTAYYAIVSLALVAILQCYVCSLLSLLWRRVYYPETLPERRWSLGRFGIPCNVLAVIWSVWAFFWSFWPQYAQVDASTFNWASVMFVGVLVFSGVFYIKQRKVYKGPVTLVAGRKGNAEMESDNYC